MLPTIFSLLLYVGAVRATAGFFKSDPNADSQCADLLWDPDRTHRARTTLENLFFMHIPKTAGTSFGGQLSAMLSAYAKHNKRRASVRVQHCYDSNNLLPTNVDRCYPDEEAQPKDEEEIVTVFKSHADILYAERLPDKTAVITMLRDPAALVESRYMYQYRNAEPNPPPLAEWVKLSQNRRAIDNRLTRTLAGGLCCVSGKEQINVGQADCADNVEDAVLSGHTTRRQLRRDSAAARARAYNATREGCPTDCTPSALLQNAKQMLQQGVFFFGLVERYEESVGYLAWKLGIPPPCLQRKLNTKRSPNAKFKSPAEIVNRTIASMTNLDSQLYQYAVELFDKNWMEMQKSGIGPGNFPPSAYLPEKLQSCGSHHKVEADSALSKLLRSVAKKPSSSAPKGGKKRAKPEKSKNEERGQILRSAKTDTQLKAGSVRPATNLRSNAGPNSAAAKPSKVLGGLSMKKKSKNSAPSQEDLAAQVSKIAQKSIFDRQIKEALSQM